ncbi:MAG: flagellar export chaperone FliS [Deltaproteobacteria bacterium]|jgi:flagellar protein FliS|nr:flagellar export chaperone FliS [Deltaproteobacteria bacterium]
MAHPMKAYQRVRITTATPAELVVLLADGLARYVAAAADAMSDGRWAEVGQHCERSVQIVCHLQESLNESVAPALVAQLDRTYETWTRCIVRAQLQRDVESMRALVPQMQELADAWRTVAAYVREDAR